MVGLAWRWADLYMCWFASRKASPPKSLYGAFSNPKASSKIRGPVISFVYAKYHNIREDSTNKASRWI